MCRGCKHQLWSRKAVTVNGVCLLRRRMHDEVRVVADSPRLSALTAKTVGKALQLMAEKAEYMTFAGRLPCLSVPLFGLHKWPVYLDATVRFLSGLALLTLYRSHNRIHKLVLQAQGSAATIASDGCYMSNGQRNVCVPCTSGECP